MGYLNGAEFVATPSAMALSAIKHRAECWMPAAGYPLGWAGGSRFSLRLIGPLTAFFFPFPSDGAAVAAEWGSVIDDPAQVW